MKQNGVSSLSQKTTEWKQTYKGNVEGYNRECYQFSVVKKRKKEKENRLGIDIQRQY